MQPKLKSYFSNVTGWLFIGILLFFTGIFATSINLKGFSARFEFVLLNEALVFLLAVPVLTMRSVADEKANKTDQLLYTLPIKMSSVIIAKYLAMITVLAITVAVMAVYPIIISLFGIMDYTMAYTALLGFFMLGCALIAIGMFLSSLTESMVIAAVLSFTAMLLLYIMDGAISILPTSSMGSFICISILIVAIAGIVYFLTKNSLISIIAAGVGILPNCICFLCFRDSYENMFPNMVSYLAVFNRFYDFAYGIFDLTAIIYFISVAVFFVFLSVLSVEKKRWN